MRVTWYTRIRRALIDVRLAIDARVTGARAVTCIGVNTIYTVATVAWKPTAIVDFLATTLAGVVRQTHALKGLPVTLARRVIVAQVK